MGRALQPGTNMTQLFVHSQRASAGFGDAAQIQSALVSAAASPGSGKVGQGEESVNFVLAGIWACLSVFGPLRSDTYRGSIGLRPILTRNSVLHGFLKTLW